jgi:hypothetical protein
MKRKRWLDSAVLVFGVLSLLSLAAFFLALTDISHDYASPDVFARAGQPLPDWYSPVNRCPLEWRILQIGFVLMLAFHGLWIAKRLSDAKKNSSD